MGGKTRREREREERREMILKAAAEIAAEEGLGNLSLRKIAARIEYSPAIIYHYFASKEEILRELLHQGYQNILRTLGAAQASLKDPWQRVEESQRRYIAMALENPDYYKAFMLSDSPAVLERTAVLFRGALEKRPSVALAARDLKAIFPERDEDWLELTVQVMWTAMFGLAMRLVIERDLPEEQKQRLVQRHIELVTGALRSM